MSSYSKVPAAPESKDFEVERHFETDLHAASRKQIKSDTDGNIQRVFDEAVAAVCVAMPERDATQNGRLRYERNYQRLREAARGLFAQTGQPVSVPRYEPPPAMVERMTTLGADDFQIDPLGRYHERKDQRNLPKEMLPDFSDPESKRTQDWLTAQGSAPLNETTGQSPAEIGKAKRKRAGEPS